MPRYRPSPEFEPNYPRPFAPPAKVRTATLDMMRTSLVTRSPSKMAETLSAYEAETPSVAMVLPQRMQWQHWKSDTVDVINGSANRARHSHPVSRIPGLVEAVLSGRAGAILAHAPGFTLPMQEVADAFVDQMASAAFDPSPMLMRDAPAEGRPVTLPGLEEDEVPLLEDIPLRADPGRSPIDRAMNEVHATQQRLRSYLFTSVHERPR